MSTTRSSPIERDTDYSHSYHTYFADDAQPIRLLDEGHRARLEQPVDLSPASLLLQRCDFDFSRCAV